MDYNARYYSPVLGRFVSPDSIVPDPSSSGGFNRYRYTRNNPVRYTDPSGHCAVCVGIAGGAIVGWYAGRVVGEVATHSFEPASRAVRDQIGGQLVTDLQEQVTAQADARNMNAGLINSVLRHEGAATERRMATFLPGSKPGFMANNAEFAEYLIRGDISSMGVAQMQLRRARELGQSGYVTARSDSEHVAALLNDATAIEYIAAELQHISDNLSSLSGFNELSSENQTRLTLIGYNQGWDILSYNIDELGFEELIERTEYDNETLDEYQRWLEGQ